MSLEIRTKECKYENKNYWICPGYSHPRMTAMIKKAMEQVEAAARGDIPAEPSELIMEDLDAFYLIDKYSLDDYGIIEIAQDQGVFSCKNGRRLGQIGDEAKANALYDEFRKLFEQEPSDENPSRGDDHQSS